MELVSLIELNKEDTDAVIALVNATRDVHRRGLVATVEQIPHPPLAMGRYFPRVTVRQRIDHNAEAAKRGGYQVERK